MRSGGLTTKADTTLDNAQRIGRPKLRSQSTASLKNLLSHLFIELRVPVTVKTTSSQDHTAVNASWENMGVS
jgi:hypothetical protein